MTSNREKYCQFCKTEKELPIFMQDWWLDAVCGEDGWDVAVVEQNGSVVGVLPFFLTKKLIFKLIVPPHLTRWLGPWIKYPEGLKDRKKLSFEHQIYTKLIEKISRFDWLSIGCNPQFSNWLSFYWKGYSINTSIIYYLTLESGYESYYNSLSKKTKQRINKGLNNCQIINEKGIDTLFSILEKTYEKQGLEVFLSKKIVNNIYEGCFERNCCEVITAIDRNNNVLASSMVVWDDNYVYLLIGGSDPKYNSTYAKYSIINEAIQLACRKGLMFNFEGSMIHQIETFYRQFEPKQLTYYTLEKINSRILKCYFALK